MHHYKQDGRKSARNDRVDFKPKFYNDYVPLDRKKGHEDKIKERSNDHKNERVKERSYKPGFLRLPNQEVEKPKKV